ncbi:MAG: hypothetical protein RL699_1683 [Bacteroidota bacterium]|jgi:hypothetical protein
MLQKIYNRTNFHRHTFCVFQEVLADELQGLVLNYKSKSGSEYFFTQAGVYRKSNHWGRAANCKWRLIPLANSSENRTKIGYADWTSFFPDNDFEKLYFIQYDPKTKQANYCHKDQGIMQEQSLLRTAAETTKVLKLIRNLVNDTTWMDYIRYQNKDNVVEFVVKQLCTSTKSLIQIKAEAKGQDL